MQNFFVVYQSVLGVLRVALFALAVLLTIVCAVDWAVRTRRLSPFGPVARFFRSTVDPMIAPVERRVVRAGGLPTNAPWWALAAVVVGGIILLTLLDFLGAQIYAATMAISQGPRGIYYLLVSLLITVLQIALFVRVITSWVRISPDSPWVRWSFVITEPILRPLRRIVPPLGMMDVTPIVAYLLIKYVLAPVLFRIV